MDAHGWINEWVERVVRGSGSEEAFPELTLGGFRIQPSEGERFASRNQALGTAKALPHNHRFKLEGTGARK
jgi:hypothetical protein